MVKPKSGISHIFSGHARRPWTWLLPLVSLLTFISSWLAVYPPNLVERWYARIWFPKISHLAGKFADAIGISWLDLAIPAGIVLLILLVRKRRWAWLLNLAAVLYLIFFWSWGLNYHRLPLASKLQLDSSRMSDESMELFARQAAGELNRLYGAKQKQKEPYDEMRTRNEAAQRVRRVVATIDGVDWSSARHIKISWIG